MIINKDIPDLVEIKREEKLLRKLNNKDKSHKFYRNIISKEYGFSSYEQLENETQSIISNTKKTNLFI